MRAHAIDGRFPPLRTDLFRPPAGAQGELERLHAAVQQKGYTCVALSIYWSKHLIKCEIALGKGKKEYDKRHTERERDSDRELQRAVRNKGKDD